MASHVVTQLRFFLLSSGNMASRKRSHALDASFFRFSRQTRSQTKRRKGVFIILEDCSLFPTDITKIIEEYTSLTDFKFEDFKEKRLPTLPHNLLIIPNLEIEFRNYLEWHFQTEMKATRGAQIKGYREATKIYPLEKFWKNGELGDNCLHMFLSCCFSKKEAYFRVDELLYSREFCFLFLVSGIMCRNLLGRCWAEYTAWVLKNARRSLWEFNKKGERTFLQEIFLQDFEFTIFRGGSATVETFLNILDRGGTGGSMFKSKFEKWTELFPMYIPQIFQSIGE